MNKIVSFHAIIFFYLLANQSHCMHDQDREHLLNLFKNNDLSLHSSNNDQWELVGNHYGYFSEQDSQGPDHSKDRDTAYDIMDSLPKSMYDKMMQASRSELALKIQCALKTIKQMFPELKDYDNTMALKHRCIVVEFEEDTNPETLQQVINYNKKYKVIPYHIEFWPDLISKWYVPEQAHCQEFCKQLREFFHLKNVRTEFPEKPLLGKQISMDSKDKTWQFYFEKGKIISSFVPYYHQKISIDKVTVNYQLDTNDVQIINQMTEEK